MRFLFGSEAEDASGRTSPQRYAEMVEQAQFAEQMGFTGFLTSEQHFNTAVSMTSAPECILAYVAAKTSTLRLRAASFVLLTFNHPVRVAERAATLDVLSGGRFEIGTARSNNPRTIKAFEVSADRDARDVVRVDGGPPQGARLRRVRPPRQILDDRPPIALVPRPVQTPYPPIFVSATSIETHVNAGKLGIGVMTGNSLPGGWEYVEEAIDRIRSGLRRTRIREPGRGRQRHRDRPRGDLPLRRDRGAGDRRGRGAREPRSREVAGWFDALAKASPEYSSMVRCARSSTAGRTCASSSTGRPTSRSGRPTSSSSAPTGSSSSATRR